jgi:hypothetical protein
MNPLTPRETLVELAGLLSSIMRDARLVESIRMIAREAKEAEQEMRDSAACDCVSPVANCVAEDWDGCCRRCGGVVDLTEPIDAMLRERIAVERIYWNELGRDCDESYAPGHGGDDAP